MTSKCYRCKQYLPLTDFNKDRTRSKGTASACKVCKMKTAYEKRKFGGPYYRSHACSSAKQRAKRLGVPFTLTTTDLPPIPECCPITGLKFKGYFGKQGPGARSCTLDRIVPELGYVPGNVQWISQTANSVKGDKSASDLRGRVDALIHTKLIRYIEETTEHDNPNL